jgi:hypothetical protein
MLQILEAIGRNLQSKELEDLLTKLPKELLNDKEKIIRFLLLTAFLDQQAESPTARTTAVRIYEIFGNDLFDNPIKVLHDLNKLASIKSEYKISPAVGRVMPRFAWFVLRVGGFLAYELMLNGRPLLDELSSCATPIDAVAKLQENATVESVLRDKAARMYISWVGHPELNIDISSNKWNKSDFLMPVDGHVGKVFCRTGMVHEVIHEGKPDSSLRWNVIIAADMRDSIQRLVNSFHKDTIMVDQGAFQVGLNCCPDNLKGICCDKCSKLTCKVNQSSTKDRKCVLAHLCKQNLTWRAF